MINFASKLFIIVNYANQISRIRYLTSKSIKITIYKRTKRVTFLIERNSYSDLK